MKCGSERVTTGWMKGRARLHSAHATRRAGGIPSPGIPLNPAYVPLNPTESRVSQLIPSYPSESHLSRTIPPHPSESHLSQLIPPHPTESHLSRLIPPHPTESHLSQLIPPHPAESHLSRLVPPYPTESHLSQLIPPHPTESHLSQLIPVNPGASRTKNWMRRAFAGGIPPRARCRAIPKAAQSRARHRRRACGASPTPHRPPRTGSSRRC